MMITVGYICYRGDNQVLKINLRPGGMTIVQQQGMEVLGVNLSPSMSFKDRYAVRPLVMLNACLTLSWPEVVPTAKPASATPAGYPVLFECAPRLVIRMCGESMA